MKEINHLAIIMDGNGRWASRQGFGRARGHVAGARTAFEIIELVSRMDIPALSLFAFSVENWQRPAREVNALMKLFAHALTDKLEFFMERGIRLNVFGDREVLPEAVVAAVERAETLSAGNSGLRLMLALYYSGRQDICRAVRALARQGVDMKNLMPEMLGENLTINGPGDPDLIIRTGGESRLSNFYLWQAAYAEIHFQNKLWPDFTESDLHDHLEKYFSTERRFGKTSG